MANVKDGSDGELDGEKGLKRKREHDDERASKFAKEMQPAGANNQSAEDRNVKRGNALNDYEEPKSMEECIKLQRAWAQQITLPEQVALRAQRLLDRCRKSVLVRISPINAAAALFIASRQEGIACTYKEISAVSGIQRSRLAHYQKAMVRLLKIPNPEPVLASETINRFCSHLQLPTDIANAAKTLANRALEKGVVSGKCPVSVATAAIAIVTGCTEKEIVKVAHVSTTTVRTCIQLLKEHADSLMEGISVRPPDKPFHFSAPTIYQNSLDKLPPHGLPLHDETYSEDEDKPGIPIPGQPMMVAKDKDKGNSSDSEGYQLDLDPNSDSDDDDDPPPKQQQQQKQPQDQQNKNTNSVQQRKNSAAAVGTAAPAGGKRVENEQKVPEVKAGPEVADAGAAAGQAAREEGAVRKDPTPALHALRPIHPPGPRLGYLPGVNYTPQLGTLNWQPPRHLAKGEAVVRLSDYRDPPCYFPLPVPTVMLHPSAAEPPSEQSLRVPPSPTAVSQPRGRSRSPAVAGKRGRKRKDDQPVMVQTKTAPGPAPVPTMLPGQPNQYYPGTPARPMPDQPPGSGGPPGAQYGPPANHGLHPSQAMGRQQAPPQQQVVGQPMGHVRGPGPQPMGATSMAGMTQQLPPVGPPPGQAPPPSPPGMRKMMPMAQGPPLQQQQQMHPPMPQGGRMPGPPPGQQPYPGGRYPPEEGQYKMPPQQRQAMPPMMTQMGPGRPMEAPPPQQMPPGYAGGPPPQRMEGEYPPQQERVAGGPMYVRSDSRAPSVGDPRGERMGMERMGMERPMQERMMERMQDRQMMDRRMQYPQGAPPMRSPSMKPPLDREPKPDNEGMPPQWMMDRAQQQPAPYPQGMGPPGEEWPPQQYSQPRPGQQMAAKGPMPMAAKPPLSPQQQQRPGPPPNAYPQQRPGPPPGDKMGQGYPGPGYWEEKGPPQQYNGQMPRPQGPMPGMMERPYDPREKPPPPQQYPSQPKPVPGPADRQYPPGYPQPYPHEMERKAMEEDMRGGPPPGWPAQQYGPPAQKKQMPPPGQYPPQAPPQGPPAGDYRYAQQPPPHEADRMRRDSYANYPPQGPPQGAQYPPQHYPGPGEQYEAKQQAQYPHQQPYAQGPPPGQVMGSAGPYGGRPMAMPPPGQGPPPQGHMPMNPAAYRRPSQSMPPPGPPGQYPPQPVAPPPGYYRQ